MSPRCTRLSLPCHFFDSADRPALAAQFFASLQYQYPYRGISRVEKHYQYESVQPTLKEYRQPTPLEAGPAESRRGRRGRRPGRPRGPRTGRLAERPWSRGASRPQLRVLGYHTKFNILSTKISILIKVRQHFPNICKHLPTIQLLFHASPQMVGIT